MGKKCLCITATIVLLSLFSCSVFKNQDKELIFNDGNYKLNVNLANLTLSFYDYAGKLIVPNNPISGIFINESPVVQTEVESKSSHEVVLNVLTEKKEKAKVNLTFEEGITKLKVSPSISNSKISVRFGGMPVAHGLGDAGGWNKSFDLSGTEEKTFDIINNGGSHRWLSTFTIFPKNNFAGVFFDRGQKNVVLSENTYQLNTKVEGSSTFYFFTGSTKEIYTKFKKLRNELGYQDIKPKSRLFELGWESWDALGWNTNQHTVKDILGKFINEGYPIRWAITGSGFWDEGGTTTSFGRFGKKFPDPEKLKNWMHQHDIYWMIGLRTNLVPSGGPYFPKTEKRDKNLKVSSFYGNPLSDEAKAKNLLLKDSTNQPRLITSRIFPIVPCYLVDGNIPGAASWFYKNYTKWKVDGIKEDAMMYLGEETSIFNKPIAKIATEGGLVIGRCGEFSAPGTLLRINDTKVSDIEARTVINYFQYAASGAPNVYSDVCGVHNMQNIKDIDSNIRHTWLLSLSAGMAVGSFPSEWKEEEKVIFKKAVNFHYALVPYLYSAGMKSYESGFPYTLTPMDIAYSEDDKTLNSENFQWMVGESVMATPLLKNYKDGKKDIYLPEGIWYDWESGEKFSGPIRLEDFEMPLNKVPCFVGGNGVVLLRGNTLDDLIARVYMVNKKTVSEFYSLKNDEKYQIKVSATNFDSISVLNTTTGENIMFKRNGAYIEIPIVEGNNYEVK